MERNLEAWRREAPALQKIFMPVKRLVALQYQCDSSGARSGANWQDESFGTANEPVGAPRCRPQRLSKKIRASRTFARACCVE